MQIKQPDYPPFGAYATRALCEILDFIVHHSAGPLTETPLEIDAQHRSQGWCCIGYSWVITPDGTVYEGRPLEAVPAAAQDDNTHSVDVCLIGNFQDTDAGYTGPPTDQQLQSLETLSIWAHQQIPSLRRTIGHRDVAILFDDPSVATACPGNRLYSQLPFIKSATWNALHPAPKHF